MFLTCYQSSHKRLPRQKWILVGFDCPATTWLSFPFVDQFLVFPFSVFHFLLQASHSSLEIFTTATTVMPLHFEMLRNLSKRQSQEAGAKWILVSLDVSVTAAWPLKQDGRCLVGVTLRNWEASGLLTVFSDDANYASGYGSECYVQHSAHDHPTWKLVLLPNRC